MRRTAMIAAVGLLTAYGIAASAQEQHPSIDTDGDGMFSLEELQALHEEVTEEVYASIDTDGNGTVDPDEYEAAIEAGKITIEEM